MLKKVNKLAVLLKKSLHKIEARTFSIYIPNEKLRLIKHKSFGLVYPVYIADKEFDRYKDPKKIVPFIGLFSAFNVFLFFSGLSILPDANIYSTIYNKQLFFYISFIANFFAIKRYLNSSLEYRNRLQKMYLNKDGDAVYITTFDGSEEKIKIDEIFESRIDNKFEAFSKSYPLFATNHNSIKVCFSYGSGREIFVFGRNFYCDWEIFKNIINRNDIDTQSSKFQMNGDPIKWYDEEEIRNVIAFSRDKNNVIYRKFYLEREISSFFKRRREYSKKNKEKSIKENDKKVNLLI